MTPPLRSAPSRLSATSSVDATSLFDPTNTIASVVAMEFPESLMGSLKQSALLALGFLLFVISFMVLAVSRWLLRPRLK